MKLRHLLLTAFLFALGALMLNSQSADHAPKQITHKQVQSVLQAVADEIYVHGHYKEFWGFETSGPTGPRAAFNVYIRPQLVPAIGGDEGVIIYKYLPFGEVLSPFIIGRDGMVYLVGNSEQGFGWTQPAMNTIYMDDEDVIKFKKQALKVPFFIELKPSRAMLSAAAARQKKRTGSSASQTAHTRHNAEAGDRN